LEFSVGFRVAAAAIVMLAASPVLAQTPEVPATPAHRTTHHAAPHKAKVAKTGASTPHRGRPTPVVAPHGSVARRKVHRGAHLVTEAPTAAHMNLPPPPRPAVKLATRPTAPVRPVIPADQGTVTGLHLPRYASLKTGDVNMRSGPGARYPVLWTYQRFALPVRIEREFDIWRLVEDMDGIKGWVHQATITGRRTFVITGTDPRTMRAEASDSAAAVAVLKPGVVGRIKSCDANAAWCQVQVGDYRGWLARADFWGSDAGEAVAP
jgi:SH3-like domain-containing protein